MKKPRLVFAEAAIADILGDNRGRKPGTDGTVPYIIVLQNWGTSRLSPDSPENYEGLGKPGPAGQFLFRRPK